MEVAMLRYKKLIGRCLHARSLPAQKTEAKVACKVINIMTGEQEPPRLAACQPPAPAMNP